MARHTATLLREREILESLKKNPSSIRGLGESLNYNYYTVRAIIADLAERGLIKIYDTIDREKIYTFNVGNEENHEFIPRIVSAVNKTTTKSVMFLSMVGNEDETNGVRAAKAIFKHIARLMQMANESRLGVNIEFLLNNERAEMQKNLIYVQQIASMYEQILKEPRYWNTKFLQEMTKDPDYNYLEIQKAVNYYKSLEELDE